MSITKIERKYIDAKDYVLDEIISIAEKVIEREEYMIRKFSKCPIDWGCHNEPL